MKVEPVMVETSDSQGQLNFYFEDQVKFLLPNISVKEEQNSVRTNGKSALKR